MDSFETPQLDVLQPPPKRWSAWDIRLVAVLTVTFVAGLLLLFFPLLRQRRELESRRVSLTTELAMEQQLTRRLQWEISALQNDRAYIERMARDKLNLAAPGETLFQFDPAPQTPPSSRR